VIAAARVLLAVALLATPGAAMADTIYLTNGRVIHTGATRIADGRVHFSQFGGTVSIPLDAVERIVEDEKVEQTTSPTVEGASPASTADRSEASRNTTPSQPVDKAEYWIERIKEVDERIARVQAELDRLPVYDDVEQLLFRFNGQVKYFVDERAKWEGFMQRLQLSRRQLLYGARKAGITPGALRKGLGK